MSTPAELEASLWSALKSNGTVMLGLLGAADGHTRPMTAQVENDKSPIWFFASKDHALVKSLSAGSRAIVTYTSKGHDLYACIHGSLKLDNDRAVIDRLWGPQVAAWYEKGKDDPKLALLRLDAENAEIWQHATASSLMAGIQSLLGVDPKQSMKDDIAKVSLKS